MAIECNPRLHSCIVLLKNKQREAGEAVGDALEGCQNRNPAKGSPGRFPLVVPDDNQRHVIWLYNEFRELTHVKTWRELTAIFTSIVQGRRVCMIRERGIKERKFYHAMVQNIKKNTEKIVIY